MVKSLKVILSALLLTVTQAASAAAFSDTANTRYAAAFDHLSQKGIIQGYNDGTARPYFAINRAEALKVMLSMHPEYAQRVEWYKSHMPGISLFVDTQQTAWYAPYLETAYEAGLVTGYPDRTFRPTAYVTAEEAITMMMRTYKLGLNGTSGGGDAWFKASVDEAIRRNLVASSEVIYLGEPLTRGQLLDIVYRMDETESKNLVAFNDGSSSRTTLTRRPTMIANYNGNGGGGGGTSAGTYFAISIPSLGIESLNVTHPKDTVTSQGLLEPLKSGVGHLFSYPGGDGKIMIYGHSSGYKWDYSKYTKIFSTIAKLNPGDRVYVNYGGKEFTYEVTGHEITEPDDIRPYQGNGEELILYTCWPVNTAKQRYIVRAKPVNAVAMNNR